MFQQRQLNDVYQLVEIVTAVVNPGAITTGGKATVVISPTSSTITLSDEVLQTFAPAAAGNLGGLIYFAAPSANGQLTVSFFNASAGTITPTSATWTFICGRITPELI